MKAQNFVINTWATTGQIILAVLAGILIGGAMLALGTGNTLNDNHWQDLAAGLCIMLAGIGITWLVHRQKIADLEQDNTSISEQRNLYEEEMAHQRSRAAAAEGSATHYETQARLVKEKHDGLLAEVDRLEAAWYTAKSDWEEQVRLHKLIAEENAILSDDKLVLLAQVHASTLYIDALEKQIADPERPDYYNRCFPAPVADTPQPQEGTVA